jgi:periplasmic divalent cation tolerance protein
MTKCNEDDIVAVTTTVASIDDARTLARALVDARLVACVQLEALAASYYRWDGRVCEDPEVRLTLKTSGARLADLESFFAEHHPYDLPQFVAVPCQASAAYAGWVRAEVAVSGS